jgi:hypothetical protein
VSDLANAGRVIYRIKMSPSTMRRMQIVGAYRDIELRQPTQQSDAPNQVKQTKKRCATVSM